MADENSRSLDILGIKPIASTIETVSKGAIDGAAAFLSRICLPAAEELGLLLQDKVRAWRSQNAVAITVKAEQKSRDQRIPEAHHAHPRLVGQILEHGSWADSDEVQDLWAGLLSSSCSPNGDDESNLMFIDTLTRLTASQVRVVNHSVTVGVKTVTQAGWLVSASSVYIDNKELLQIAGIDDKHQLDRELDHLRTLGLLDDAAGFMHDVASANITPTPLALQMYARCHGYRGDPLTFFGVTPPVT